MVSKGEGAQAAFPLPLVMEKAGMRGQSRLFKLAAPFVFVSSKGKLEVPVGFITDGYSVPSWLHSWCNPFAEGMELSFRRQAIYRAVRLVGWRYYKPRN